MKLSQQVAEAAAVARTSTSAEQDKNAEIAQHIKYAKERITASISDMSKTNLLRGQRLLACGEPVQSGRSMKQEPAEATHSRHCAAPERRRNPPPKDGGGCQTKPNRARGGRRPAAGGT